MTDDTVTTPPLFAKRDTNATNDKGRKPTRCQECGHKRIRLIDGRYCCYFCGEVQT